MLDARSPNHEYDEDPSRRAVLSGGRRAGILGVQDGEPVLLALSQSPDFFTGILTWRGCRVGHVYFAIDGSEATLQDIYLQERVPTRGGFLLRLLGRPRFVSFRGLGWGTKLLTASLEAVSVAGICVVRGEAVGEDVPRLLRWYCSLGFRIDEGTAQIEVKLTKARGQTS